MNKRNNRGMTLIETMLTLVITLGLIGGAMSLLMFMQKQARNQQSRVSLTQEARFVLKQLTSELKNSGSMISFMGSGTFLGGQLPFYGIYPLNNTNGPDGMIIASASPYYFSRMPEGTSFTAGDGTLNVVRTDHTYSDGSWRKDDLIMVISKQGYCILKNTADQIANGSTSIPVDPKPIYYSGLLQTGSYTDRLPNSQAVTYNASDSVVIKLSHFGIYLLHDMDLVRVSDTKGQQNPFLTSSDPDKDPVMGVIASDILDLQIIYRSFGDPNTFPDNINITEYFMNGPNGIPGTGDGSTETAFTRALLKREIKEVEMHLIVLTSEFKSGQNKSHVTTEIIKAHGDRGGYNAISNTLPAGSTSKKLPGYFTYRTYEVIADMRNLRPRY